MTTVQLLRRLLDRDRLFKLILILLLYALVPLAEIFLFLYLGNLIGNYLVLIIAAVAGVGGALVALGELRRIAERLRNRINQGSYPGREFMELAGLLVAGVLLITPGFITDLCGYLLLVPSLRAAAGRFVVKKLDSGFKEVYEHLKLAQL
ncbi:MAG: FxsA family protein [Spirochaetia bacterium]|jgi:UPF0716 protein FxsA